MLPFRMIAKSMDVTAIAVFLAPSRERRGRICQRPDGRFQFVTETLQPESAEAFAYWTNDWPPSGIYSEKEGALSALESALPSMKIVEGVKPVGFDIRIGPYPEPTS